MLYGTILLIIVDGRNLKDLVFSPVFRYCSWAKDYVTPCRTCLGKWILTSPSSWLLVPTCERDGAAKLIRWVAETLFGTIATSCGG
jgi:hypothetical protein